MIHNSDKLTVRITGDVGMKTPQIDDKSMADHICTVLPHQGSQGHEVKGHRSRVVRNVSFRSRRMSKVNEGHLKGHGSLKVKGN